MTKSDNKTGSADKGNSGIIAVVVILIAAAIGAGAYFSGMIDMKQITNVAQNVAQSDQESETTNTAKLDTPSSEEPAPAEELAEATEEIVESEPAAGAEEAVQESAEEAKEYVIEPGNPTIAKLNGSEIKRTDLYRFMQQMGPQIQGQNMETLYPIVQDQLINNQIISQKTQDVDLSGDEAYEAMLNEAKLNITRQLFLQKEIDARLTDERIKKEYDMYVKDFPKTEELKAWHILVDEEATAKEIIEKLNNGGSFEELAKEYSKDTSAEKGGELDYFAKGEVVPEFAAAAFALDAGSYTTQPVKSQFGYHIIKAGDVKQREPVGYDEAKPQIAQQLRGILLNEVLDDWRKSAEIEKFDINGKNIESAAGE